MSPAKARGLFLIVVYVFRVLLWFDSLFSYPSFSFLLSLIFINSALKSCFLKLTRFLECLLEQSRSSLFVSQACFLWPAVSLFLILLYCACLPPMLDLPCSSDGKESVCSAGDPGSIPGSERSSGEGNGNPLQCSWLENPMDRGPWQTTVHVVTKSQTQLSDQYSTKERSWKILPLCFVCSFLFHFFQGKDVNKIESTRFHLNKIE